MTGVERKAPSSRCSLLTLPVELRITIYNFIFGTIDVKDPRDCLVLLDVNAQVCFEAARILLRRADRELDTLEQSIQLLRPRTGESEKDFLMRDRRARLMAVAWLELKKKVQRKMFEMEMADFRKKFASLLS